MQTDEVDSTGLAGVNILVVEDNEINALIVKKFIEKWGGQTSYASSGKKALEIIASHSFDLILMDLQMPEMDGFEATAQIRLSYPDIPIIALTADIMSDTKNKVLASGMTNYLQKPFNPGTLRQLIDLHKRQ